jgi:hypothetical protein
MMVNCHHTSAALPQEKEPQDSHWTGNLEGAIVALDVVGKNFLSHFENLEPG